VAFVNPLRYEYHFDTAAYVEAPLDAFVEQLAAVLAAAAKAAGVPVPRQAARIADAVEVADAHAAAAAALARKPGLVLLGHIAQRHPRYADIRALAAALAEVTGARLGYLSEGANAVGAALAGALPHRGVGGEPQRATGCDAQAMLETPRKGYILFGIEPSKDLAGGARALAALKAATVVCFTPYVTDELLECADVLLPTATFAETAGTFVNAEGRWQSFDAVADAPGEARPAWRVLRVLGNELGLPNCEYRNPSEVSAALERELGNRAKPEPGQTEYHGAFEPSAGAGRVDGAELDVPIYAVDAVVRRSAALQQTALGRRPDSAV
jgi:NADH-quinone oxidoreductase subunit G